MLAGIGMVVNGRFVASFDPSAQRIVPNDGWGISCCRQFEHDMLSGTRRRQVRTVDRGKLEGPYVDAFLA